MEPGAGGNYLGVPYALPRANYVLEVTRELKSCNKAVPEVATKIVVKEVMTRDTSATYYIDYGKVKSWTKTVDFNATFYQETGGIKQLGVSVTDYSKDVLVGVAKAGIAAAGIATGNPLVAGAALAAGTASDGAEAEPLQTTLLSDTTKSVVPAPIQAAVAAQIRKLGRAAPKDDESCTCSKEAIEHLEAIKLLRGERKKIANDLEKDDKKTTDALVKIDRQIAEIKDYLVRSSVYVLDERSPYSTGNIVDKRYEPGADFRKEMRAGLKPDSSTVIDWFHKKYRYTAFLGMLLHWKLAVKDSQSPIRDITPCEVQTDEKRHGITYRDPVNGILLVAVGNNLALETPVSVPQAGRCITIPYSNLAFEDNALQLDFRIDGGLEKFAYKDKKARAKEAVGAAQEVAGSLAKAQTSAMDAKLAEYRRLKEELELKAAIMKQLNEYQKTFVPAASE